LPQNNDTIKTGATQEETEQESEGKKWNKNELTM